MAGKSSLFLGSLTWSALASGALAEIDAASYYKFVNAISLLSLSVFCMLKMYASIQDLYTFYLHKKNQFNFYFALFSNRKDFKNHNGYI